MSRRTSTARLPARAAATRRTIRQRAMGQRGSVTPFVVTLVLPVVMMAGLAFDGGRVLAARRDAIDTAQSAALAGAQAADLADLREGRVRLDPHRARAAAQQYLASSGHNGTVDVTTTDVTVTITENVDMALLGAIGIGPQTVTGTATSRLLRGVNEAE